MSRKEERNKKKYNKKENKWSMEHESICKKGIKNNIPN